MDKTVALALLCLSLALLIVPLTQHKPGLPATLKADEAAYYLAALSLVKDGDLRCEPKDLARLFQEYPYRPVHNLILATDDGWRTVYYGKPYIFSLLAAPLAALWGANGLVLFNASLLVAMIWMATLYLRRYNPDWLAALFAVGFFLMSTTFTYVFWLQPELLNMFATAACLFLGLHVFDPRGGERWRPGAFKWPPMVARLAAKPNLLALVGSASALAIGVYNKPMLAAIGLPVCFRLLRHRCWRELVVWVLSAVLATGALAGLSIALTGHPTSYLGVDRQGFNIHTPHRMPMEPKELTADGVPLGRKTAGWWWIFRVPRMSLAEFREDATYFFFGRHTGLFLYQPFSFIALLLFLAFGRRSAVRWAVAGVIALIAVFFLCCIPHNWHGGGGFVGNRYFIMVYPAFVFLVTRIRPDWIVAPGFAAGGLFVGSLVFSPFGLVVPSPTLQAHARNHPFQIFPFEHSLVEVPGYQAVTHAGVYVRGRKDHMRIEGESLWIAASQPTELWLSSQTPIQQLVLAVTSPVPENPVTLRIEDASDRLIAGREPQRVELSPSRPTLIRRDRHLVDRDRLLDIYVYKMEIRTATGEMPRWRDTGLQFFYKGCSLTFVGRDDVVETPP